MNEMTTTVRQQVIDLAPLAPSRRGIIAALAGGFLARGPFGLGVAGVEAKGGKRRKGKGKKNKNGKQRGPKTRADAACPGPRDNAFIVNGGTRLAQTFSASASGALVRAELIISKETGTNGDYLLHLSPVDNSGVPTNDVLAVALVADASVPDGESPVAFAFPNPVPVNAGAEFALVVTRLDGGNLTWSSRAGDACAGRAYVSAPASTGFEFRPGDDFLFTTFVRA